MTAIETINALRPLAASHSTAQGIRHGFLMADATRVLGSLAAASNALAVLLAEGLVESEPIILGEDVCTLYRLSGATPPLVH